MEAFEPLTQSLRVTLADFERTGDLHYIDRPVNPRYELGTVLALRGHGPTQFFRRVTGYPIPVVGNLLNTRAKIAQGLGVPLAQLQRVCLAALAQGIPPEIVAHGPAQEVVQPSPRDIPSLLPVPTWFEQEGGPYITAGVVVAKDSQTGRRNVSIARFRLEGGNRLLAGIAPSHHLSELLRRAQAQGRPLEIAIAIGNHPALLLASQMYVHLGHDEYDIAGGLLGQPLRLVRCQTVNLEVPAEAEIVLEGLLHADRRLDEGAVSEFPGFYVHYGPGHEVEIQTITHRRDAIYHAILPGYAPEHLLLGATAISATTCRVLQQVMPNVRQVFVTEGGMGRLHAIVTIHQPKRGEGKRAIMLAMGQVNLLKLVIVVDDDIDPADWIQVEWALAARFRGQEDLIVIPGAKADRCEPQERDLTVTKIGIVATTQPGSPAGKFEFVRPPQAVWEKVQQELESY
jgi:UbiD family decarboxylase